MYTYVTQDYLAGGSDEGEDDDDEDEGLRYERELEESLERSYRLYLQRKGHREELAKVSGSHLANCCPQVLKHRLFCMRC